VACCEPSLARLLAKKYRVSSRVSAQLASDVPFSADGMDANGRYGQGDGFTVARSVQGVLAPVHTGKVTARIRSAFPVPTRSPIHWSLGHRQVFDQ
jgi:hypothetical protein